MITGKKRKQKVYRVLNEHMSNTFSLSPNEQLYEKHQNNKSLQIARLLQVRSQSKQINLENRSKYHSSLSAVWSEALSDVKVSLNNLVKMGV